MTFTKTHDAHQMLVTHAAMASRITRAALCCVVLAACALSDQTTAEEPVRIDGGDAARGHAILASGAHGCTGCHSIPGVRGAHGTVGPPLDGTA